jgi:membrane protein implicated in regulation of membrane protease activity
MKTVAGSKWYVFIAAFFVSGMPMWFTNYATYSGNSGIFLLYGGIVCAVASGILAHYAKHKTWKIIFFMALAHQLAFIGKVFIDGMEDRSNHNLLPFEMIIFLVIDLLFSWTLVSIVRQTQKQYMNK